MQTAAQLLNRTMTRTQPVQEPVPSSNSNATAGREGSTKGNSSNQNDRVQLIGESDIDDLFMHMTTIYGAKFSSAWGEFDENGVWLAELACFTRKGLARGIKRCRQAVRESARTGEKAWPPQPLEFAGLCEPLPEDFGMPDAGDAWHEAVQHSHDPSRHRWSHKAVYLAGQHVGWSNIQENRRIEKGKTPAQRFMSQYKALVNRVMSGEPLVAQHLLELDALRSPADIAERASRERAAQQAERFSSLRTSTDALSAMRAMIGS